MPQPERPWVGYAQTARQQLIECIDATGGLDADDCPVADPEWLDLGMAYLQACKEEGLEPFQEKENG